MEDVLSGAFNDRIAGIVRREQGRLRNFLKKRVSDPSDVEDILQDVFYELVEAYRMVKPVEQVGAWLFRVARNRVIDLFRKKRPVSIEDVNPSFEELLPSPEAGPDAQFARSLLWQELEDALAELPSNQREVFIATEIDGRSFKDISAETGVSVNTLLSRKRYAVLHLRERLKEIREEILGEKK